MFYLFIRYFTSAKFVKHAKDALKKELKEENLRSSIAGALETLESPEKSPQVEAAAAPDSSSFMKEFEQVLEEWEDPGAADFSTDKTITASDNPYQY